VSLAKREAEAGQLSEFSLFFLVAGSGCVCVCVFWQGWENGGKKVSGGSKKSLSLLP